MNVIAVERALSPYAVIVVGAYPRAFQAGDLLIVTEDIIAVETAEYYSLSDAVANRLREAGYFFLLGQIMYMVNREKTVPRVDWDIVEETRSILESVF